MRALVGILVLALAALALWAVFLRPSPVAEPIGAVTSSRQCRSCHEEVYREWEASWHAQSWTDPLVRAPDQSNDFANADCIDCHAPRPVFETGVGERVLPRATRRIEGVDCIACHLLPDGRVAGSVTNDAAPCRPVARTELASPEFCAGCHNQHGTVDQWRASEWPSRSKDCRSCHMPEVPRSRGRTGRDHHLAGGHDPKLLQRAVAISAEVLEGSWRARVENVGAGHNFPTDERSRASDLFWRPVGESTWRWLYRFRNPYRFEVDLPDTELAAHDAVWVPIEGADPSEPVELLLSYKLTPIWDDPDAPDPEADSTATVVHREVFHP